MKVWLICKAILRERGWLTGEECLFSCPNLTWSRARSKPDVQSGAHSRKAMLPFFSPEIPRINLGDPGCVRTIQGYFPTPLVLTSWDGLSSGTRLLEEGTALRHRAARRVPTSHNYKRLLQVSLGGNIQKSPRGAHGQITHTLWN